LPIGRNNSAFNIKQTLGRRGEDDLTRVRAKPLPAVTPPSGLSTSKVNMASGSLTEVTAVNRDSGRSAAVRNPPEVTEGPQAVRAVCGVDAEKGSGSGRPGEVSKVSGMQREDCKPEVGSYTGIKRYSKSNVNLFWCDIFAMQCTHNIMTVKSGEVWRNYMSRGVNNTLRKFEKWSNVVFNRIK
jgi:hypothetical protein